MSVASMKFYNGINKVEKVLVAIVTVLLVAVVFLQVVNRTIIKATIAWPEEVAGVPGICHRVPNRGKLLH